MGARIFPAAESYFFSCRANGFCVGLPWKAVACFQLEIQPDDQPGAAKTLLSQHPFFVKARY